MEEALDKINENKLDAATSCLEEGKESIIKRQKLIRIADREEDGWNVVDCYVSDDLASNSEDEKSLARARREAGLRRKRNEQNEKNCKKDKELSLILIGKHGEKKDLITHTTHTTEKQAYVTYATSQDITNMHVQNEQDNLCSFDNQEHEYSVSDDVSVVGRLKQNSDFWKSVLKAPPFVQNIIDEGYVIPFKEPPPSFCAKNNKSTLKHQAFVTTAIEKLLKNGAITEVSSKPYCCNPLTVAEKPKLRLVLDLRHVNEFVVHKKFKYEDLRTLSGIFIKNDYFTSFDLKSGYHHVDIHPGHRKYLGFQWIFSDRVRYFVFNVLPFGLSEACFVFTKVMRPFVKAWIRI